MNRVFSELVSLLKFSLPTFAFLLALGVTAGANAAEPAKPAKPDASKGEALYANGDPSRNIPACVACHGANGNSTIVQNPKLAAQHPEYIVKELQNFQGPTRNNAVMTAIAKQLTPDDMKNVAAWLNAQAAKPGAARNKDTIDLGKKIYRGGIAEKSVPACAGCHSPNGAGIPAQYPRLAGQHQDYTVAQLTNFRAGTRSNSPQMMTIAKRLSDDEMKAVADYIAGLK